MSDPVLEVTVLHPRDAAAAQDGGAHRLYVGALREGTTMSPELSTVSAVCAEGDLPVFVLLRLNDTWTTTGGELARLVGLAESYLGCGAAGVSFGFLDTNLDIDTEVCAHLAGRLPGVPWTFHRAVDAVLEPARAWRALADLPGLVAVCSAGSPQGLEVGFEDLLATAEASARYAGLMMPGGGLRTEHVPWLLRAGVHQFHLGPQVRTGGDYHGDVDADLVRSWRLVLGGHDLPRGGAPG